MQRLVKKQSIVELKFTYNVIIKKSDLMTQSIFNLNENEKKNGENGKHKNWIIKMRENVAIKTSVLGF